MSAEAYSVHTDVKFHALERMDIRTLQAAVKEKVFSQTLCQVNEAVVRLGIIQGELHWHKHDQEDEFFYVVDGRFLIDLDDHTVELTPQQSFVVPKGVRHRTRAAERTVVLMVERGTVTPTGDA